MYVKILNKQRDVYLYIYNIHTHTLFIGPYRVVVGGTSRRGVRNSAGLG